MEVGGTLHLRVKLQGFVPRALAWGWHFPFSTGFPAMGDPRFLACRENRDQCLINPTLALGFPGLRAVKGSISLEDALS